MAIRNFANRVLKNKNILNVGKQAFSNFENSTHIKPISSYIKDADVKRIYNEAMTQKSIQRNGFMEQVDTGQLSFINSNSEPIGSGSYIKKYNAGGPTLIHSKDGSPKNNITEDAINIVNNNKEEIKNQLSFDDINLDDNINAETEKITENISDAAESMAKSNPFSFSGIPKQAKVVGLMTAGALINKMFDDDN